MYTAAVLTISDKCFKGQREDASGRLIEKLLAARPYKIKKYEVIPDEPALIIEKLKGYCDTMQVDLVLTNGGTGFGARDVTPEATREVIEREVPGIPEAMRVLCLKLTKKAMLSRCVAGLRKKTLIVNLPGSPRGVGQSLEAVIDTIGHGLDMIAGKEHKE